jgi:hypothetical protein
MLRVTTSKVRSRSFCRAEFDDLSAFEQHRGVCRGRAVGVAGLVGFLRSVNLKLTLPQIT